MVIEQLVWYLPSGAGFFAPEGFLLDDFLLPMAASVTVSYEEVVVETSMHVVLSNKNVEVMSRGLNSTIVNLSVRLVSRS